jgi:hypothetical protein
VLFIFFWLRRRRKKQKQRDASIAAGLATLGHNRSLIDEDDQAPPPPGMMQRTRDSQSFSSQGEEREFNPYTGYSYGTGHPYVGSMKPGQPYNPPGYEMAPTQEPISNPLNRSHTPELSFGTTMSSQNQHSHVPSTPPLTGDHHRTASTTPLMTQIVGIDEPDRPSSPVSHYSDREEKGNAHLEALNKTGSIDPRLNPALLSRADSQGGGSLGDHVDYTRPLTVK